MTLEKPQPVRAGMSGLMSGLEVRYIERRAYVSFDNVELNISYGVVVTLLVVFKRPVGILRSIDNEFQFIIIQYEEWAWFWADGVGYFASMPELKVEGIL